MLAQRRRRWPNIISQLNQQGFPRVEKIKNFECLKWPILTEMTAKPGIYCHFLYQQGGGIPPLWG